MSHTAAGQDKRGKKRSAEKELPGDAAAVEGKKSQKRAKKSPPPRRHNKKRAAAAVDDEHDESFFDLLCSFARLPLLDDATDPCPVCSKQCSPVEFAKHVLECVQTLEDAEMAAREQHLYLVAACDDAKHHQDRHQHRHQHQHHHQHHSPSSPSDHHHHRHHDHRHETYESFDQHDCSEGAACESLDYEHHRLLRHPDVPCPSCGGLWPLYALSSHVTTCLESEKKKPADDDEDEDMGMTTTTKDKTTKTKHDEDESMSTAVTKSSPLNSELNSEGQDMFDFDASPAAAVQDSKNKATTCSSSLSSSSSSSSPAPKLTSAAAGLSRGQIQSMAALVLTKREEHDFDLAGLLDSFKHLGFTRANLQLALSEDVVLSPATSSSSLQSSPPASSIAQAAVLAGAISSS